jgi:hypothetical protein
MSLPWGEKQTYVEYLLYLFRAQESTFVCSKGDIHWLVVTTACTRPPKICRGEILNVNIVSKTAFSHTHPCSNSKFLNIALQFIHTEFQKR